MHRRFKLTIVALLVSLVAWLPATPSSATETDELMHVSIIDVGQGDSILVQFPTGETMLIDAGSEDEGLSVVRYIRSRNVEQIDILAASHPHEDHIGGMPDVINAFDIGKVWDSGYNHGSNTQGEFLGLIQQRQIQFGTPRAGFAQDIGDVHVEILAPGLNLLSGTNSDANNSSIVIHMAYNEVSFLFTGDMEVAERHEVDYWPHCTVLKIAHHGSSNGTDLEFLQEVAPEIAVISYGTGNEYGHPHRETINALNTYGCYVKSTAANGTIIFTTDGSTYEVTTTGGSDTTNTVDNSPTTRSGSSDTGGDSGSGCYIGNINSHIFHRPTCSCLPNPENRVYFDTRDEAIAAGYRPCQRCNP